MMESIALAGVVIGSLGLGVIFGYSLAAKSTSWHKPIAERKPRVKLEDLSSAEFPSLQDCSDADDLEYWPNSQRPDSFMGCG